MWVKIAENNCINLGLAARIIVQETRTSDPAADDPAADGPAADGPAPAEKVARFDVEALYPDERRYALASFPVCPDCGHYQAEAKAGEVFARIMRAAGDGKALLDLTQKDDPRPSTTTTTRSATDASPIRFAM